MLSLTPTGFFFLFLFLLLLPSLLLTFPDLVIFCGSCVETTLIATFSNTVRAPL